MAKLFVGSLSWNTTNDSLREAFSQHGEVVDSFVCCDRETGRSRGFGFITFANAEDAEKAKIAMDQTELDERTIKVDNASERSSGGGNGGGRGGYGGNNRNGGGGGYGNNDRDGGYGGRNNSGGGGYGNNDRDGGYGGRSNNY